MEILWSKQDLTFLLNLRGGKCNYVERRMGYKNKYMVNILVVCVIQEKDHSFVNSQAQALLIHFDAQKTEVLESWWNYLGTS